MTTRVAVMSIIVDCVKGEDSVEALNALLHDHGKYIIGRMGLPYRERKINLISVALDAPQDVVSALSGRIGKLPGVTVKTAYSGVIADADGSDSADGAEGKDG